MRIHIGQCLVYLEQGLGEMRRTMLPVILARRSNGWEVNRLAFLFARPEVDSPVGYICRSTESLSSFPEPLDGCNYMVCKVR